MNDDYDNAQTDQAMLDKLTAKHTPGPWEYSPDDPTQRYVYSITGHAVAQVNPLPLNFTHAQADADGALIAAAPDLLSALALLRLQTLGEPFAQMDRDDLRDIVDAAITKAEGRQL